MKLMLNKKFLIKLDPVPEVLGDQKVILAAEKYKEDSSTGTIVLAPVDTTLPGELVGKRVGFRSNCVIGYDKEHRIVHERDLDWIE
jgi:hypothetical protein